MRARQGFVLGVVVASACVLASACSGKVLPAGGVMVAFSSDMSMPKDVDTLEVLITQHGVTRFQQDYSVGPSPAQTMPATLLVLPPTEDQTSPVQVRVIALQSGSARVLRDSILVVPTAQVALLRMPLDWLCEGSAANTPATSTSGPTYVPTLCPTTGQTCVAGACATATIDPPSLTPYDPGSVFGGGSATGAGGTCFDTLACFSPVTLAAVDLTACTIAEPTGGAGTNVAIVVGRTGEGICGAAGCLVPLDANSSEGWQASGGKIQLPPAVCTKINSGDALGVTTTTACATKTASVPTCGPWSSVTNDGGVLTGSGGSNSDGGTVSEGDATTIGLGPDGSPVQPADGSSSVDGGGSAVTIYAHTDTVLYSVNPQTHAVTQVGPFVGAAGAVTDLAVSAAGDVYVCTATTLYKATVPPTAGNVNLATVATFTGAAFYALAFAPAGALGASETLVGGDANGEVWLIDTTTGAAKDLGSFGPDPSIPGNTLMLSGDLVFYTASSKPAGLATVHSCAPGDGGALVCDNTNDFLVGVDMTALATASSSDTPSLSLTGGIYGGTGSSTGSGTGFGEIFGLAASNGSVFGFTHYQAGKTQAQLITISPSTGVGTSLQSFATITTGWAGAGVTSSLTLTLQPPPPPPPK